MNGTATQQNTTSNNSIGTNEPSSSLEKEEEVREEDDEGLLMNGYDIVIVGTGITQSILSCALSLAGKSVLHCDGNDYYGGSYGSSFDPDSFVKMFGSKSDLEISNDSKNLCNDYDDDNVIVLSSPPLIRVHKVTSGSSDYSSQEANYKVGERLNTVYGEGVVEHVEYVVSSTIGFDCVCKLRIRLSYGILYQSRSFIGGWNEPGMQYKKRKFIMDTCPKFILNNGPAVRGLVDSGVANYMEFKGVLGVNFAQKEKNGIINIHKVPSNKSDVFKCKFIGNIDKRKLMRVLGVIRDYGTAKYSREIEDSSESDDNISSDLSVVTSLNERQLNAGRSLHRPQNKSINNDQLEKLEEYSGRPFREYLIDELKLSSRLADLIQFSLAMDSRCNISTEKAVENIFNYLNSLGYFHTSTGLLQCMYGTGEFSSSFCRSAAVHGAIFLLRRRAVQLNLGDCQDRDSESKVVTSVSLAPDPDGYGCPTEKQIKCRYCVVPFSMLSKNCNDADVGAELKIWRLTLVTKATTYFPDNEERHVSVLPPSSVGNSNPILAVHLDYFSNVAPAGCSIYQLSGLFSDESSNSYPEEVLREAWNLVREQWCNDDVFELWSSVFYTTCTSTENNIGRPLPSNVVTVPDDSELSQIYLDDHFEAAKKLYEKIVGNDGHPFLLRDKTKYQNPGDESDEEDGAQLQKAMDLIDT